MLEIVLAFVLILLVLICIFTLAYIRWHYGSLEKLGIPVVKPHFILGSNHNHDVIFGHEQDREWVKTYGEIFGVYEGRVPKIYVCNPEIVRQICIKDAEKFPNRGISDSIDLGTLGPEFMNLLRDEKWKTVRSGFSPIFTTAKLKKLSRQIIDASAEFAELVKSDIAKSKNGIIEDYNLHKDVYLMQIDLVARCTLNIKVENVRDPQNEFAVALSSMFGNNESHPIVKKLKYSLPFLQKFTSGKTIDTSTAFFEKVYKAVLDQRRKSGEKSDDFIDLLLELMEKVKSSSEFKRLGITDRTILANAVQFYFAGQDNISTAIAMVAYHVTKDPEIEKKLHEELDAYFQRHNGQVDYEAVHELVYLNACLQEALRLYPVFTRTDRKCNQDTEIKGIEIKKGQSVVVPLWPYNRNPKYFDDPDTFNPERFMPLNRDKLNPLHLATWGWGPRMCIGMRFAQEMTLFTALYIFKNFKFSTKPETKIAYVPGLEVIAYLQNLPFNVQLR